VVRHFQSYNILSIKRPDNCQLTLTLFGLFVLSNIIMDNKSCSICEQEFPATTEYFQKSSKSKNQIGSYCKSCQKQYRKNYYSKCKDKENKSTKKYYQANKDKLIKANCEWYKKNRDRLRPYRNKLRRTKRQNNIKFRMTCNLRNRVNKILRGKNKSASTLKLLGCSVEYLKIHLESKFDQNMSWDNYGKWHIDHIRPCSSFDFSDPTQQKECFHYSNLQPLWAKDNLKKSDSWDLSPKDT
jgi:hypothetical protein